MPPNIFATQPMTCFHVGSSLRLSAKLNMRLGAVTRLDCLQKNGSQPWKRMAGFGEIIFLSVLLIV